MLSLLWIPSDMLAYYRLNKQSQMNCGLATQAWDKGDNALENRGCGRVATSKFPSYVLLCTREGNNIWPLLRLSVHWASFSEKGTHSGRPQGPESDSRFSSANPCEFHFTGRPWSRQWGFCVLSTFISAESQQDRPGFGFRLWDFPAKQLWASQLTFLHLSFNNSKLATKDSDLSIKD